MLKIEKVLPNFVTTVNKKKCWPLSEIENINMINGCRSVSLLFVYNLIFYHMYKKNPHKEVSV